MKTSSEKFDSVKIEISQPVDGHRYGEESLALAGAFRVGPEEVMADICSGCGVVGLYIAARDKPKKVFLVEIQPELNELALRNVEKNFLGDTVECVGADYRDFARDKPKKIDAVVSNPPFFKKGEGRVPASKEKAIAKHEIHGSLEELFACAEKILKGGGRLAIVFPVERKSEANKIAGQYDFSVLRDHGTCSGGKFFICEYVLKNASSPA